MNKKLRLSASQISLFKRCKRAWYLRYIEKIKEPYKPWLTTGVNFHSCIEGIYKKILGEEVKEKYYDRELIDMVRDAFDKGVLYVPNKFIPEKRIKFDINEHASMIGYVDLIDVTDGKLNDHKTIKSSKWALNEDQLKEDLQLNIYGYWYLKKIPSRKHVWFRHNQLHKIDSDLSTFVEVKVSRDDVYQYWETEIAPLVDEIVELKIESEKSKYICEQKSCGDYGGCGYKDNCEEHKYL